MGRAKLNPGEVKKTRAGKAAKVPLVTDAEEVKVDKVKPSRKDKTRKCPECGVDNPSMRVTCEVCGTAMYRDVKTVLYEQNKKLKEALTNRDEDTANVIRAIIRAVVDERGNGAYRVDESGYAIQIAPTNGGTSVDKKPKKTREIHKCPCCGVDTNPGSYFVPGHDGRIKGMFNRLDKGEEVKATDRVAAMYEAWVESGRTKTVKVLASEIGE